MNYNTLTENDIKHVKKQNNLGIHFEMSSADIQWDDQIIITIT